MRNSSAKIAVLAVCCVLGCSHSESQPAPSALRYGSVMVEVGRRFELAGRAANAGRFQLAAFEVDELRESFEQDLPRAEPPKEGDAAALPGFERAFLAGAPERLKKAAQARDPVGFRAAFSAASVLCNDCHRSTGHGYIEVPKAPGERVPDVEPPDAGP